MVEVVSSLERDGRPVFRDLRWGVYVVLKAPNDYAAACFKQYGLPTDPTGRYAAMYKPFHLIGLELSISVLNAALRGEPTGSGADMARRCGRGRQARRSRPARCSTARAATRSMASSSRRRAASRSGALPIGLAHKVPLTNDVAAGAIVRWSDVAIDAKRTAVRIRREAEAMGQARAA